MSDPAWLDLARRTAPCRPDVRRLCEALRPVDPAQVQAALGRAVAEGTWDAAQGLLLGSVAAGRAPDPDLLLAVLPHLEAGWETVAALVGACPGDKVALLLRAVASRRLGIDWEVEALRLAVALLHHESRAATPELRRALRAAARSGEVADDLAPLLAEAVVVTGDADARRLTRAWEDGQDPQQTWLRLAREEAARPLLEALPEEPPPKLAAGYTLRRAVDKVGRNDPCPCGSGKKFKKCCEGAQAAREGDPSPVEGATLSEVLADPARWLTLEQLGALSLKELLRVDPARTTDEQLQRLIELLARSGYWERVEPLLEVLGARERAPDRPEDQADPIELSLTAVVIEAEAQGASAPLVRLVDRWGERMVSPPAARARRALHAGDPGALDALEELARAGLAGDDAWEQALDLGYALLAARPALGIFVARGALDPAHPHDGDTLLGEVERARDRLLLPPGDPAWEGWDRLTGRAALPAGQDAAAGEDEEADLDTLRERVRALAARAGELEQALERERGERRRDERRGAPARVAAAEPEELRRLRAKVEELKALLAEGAEERRGLREELKALQLAREEAEQERAPAGAEEREPDEAEEEGEAFPASERAPLVPAFSEAAAKALRGLDPPTARLALRAVHRLAAGDPGAWSGAKRLQKVRDLASARVGIHHRLLFRPRPERSELEVVDLIHRRELEATLRRR